MKPAYGGYVTFSTARPCGEGFSQPLARLAPSVLTLKRAERSRNALGSAASIMAGTLTPPPSRKVGDVVAGEERAIPLTKLTASPFGVVLPLTKVRARLPVRPGGVVGRVLPRLRATFSFATSFVFCELRLTASLAPEPFSYAAKPALDLPPFSQKPLVLAKLLRLTIRLLRVTRSVCAPANTEPKP